MAEMNRDQDQRQDRGRQGRSSDPDMQRDRDSQQSKQQWDGNERRMGNERRGMGEGSERIMNEGSSR